MNSVQKHILLFFRTITERDDYIRKYEEDMGSLEIKDRLISFTLINNTSINLSMDGIIFKYVEAKNIEDGYFNIIKEMKP
ncbi:MAG: hypothetical protein LBR15_06470 [Methanobrevibacter sp.]|jgi:hypothetical protein|nr:hypothetical protein [Candidatus Methanovirga australis]